LAGPAAAAAPTFNVRDLQAKGDGKTDDAAAIRSAVDAASAAGGGEVLIPTGTYLIESTVRLASKVTLRGEAGARIKLGPAIPSNGVGLDIQNASDVLVEGVEVDGNKSAFAGATEYRHAVRVMSSDGGTHGNVTLRHLYLHDAKGDGLYVGRLLSTTGHVANVRAEDVRCDANHRNGLSVSDLRGGRFQSCQFTNSRGTAPASGVDIEPNEDTATIEDIDFDTCEASGNAGVAGFEVFFQSMAGLRQGGITFHSCSSHSNPEGDGWHLRNARRVQLDRCRADRNGEFGIYLRSGGESIQVLGGEVRRSGQHGIYALGSGGTALTGLTVRGVQISDNGSDRANSRDGVQIDWTNGRPGGTASNLEFSGCTIGNDGTSNQRYGLWLTAGTRQVAITGNRFAGNSTRAVRNDGDLGSTVERGNKLQGKSWPGR
jgi:polygalacturonase